MNSQSLTGLLTGRNATPWQKPQFNMPMLVKPSDIEYLGRDQRGREWHRHRKYGELTLRGGLLDDSFDVLPETVIVEAEAGGKRGYQAFDLHAPGTYERFINTLLRTPKPKPAPRPVDRLGSVFLAERIPERIFASAARRAESLTGTSPSAPVIKSAAPPARGAEAVIARLARNGATVALSVDRAQLVVSCVGGSPGPGVVELVEAAGPLMLAYLQGSPLQCDVTKHTAEATTFALGGAPWCGECKP